MTQIHQASGRQALAQRLRAASTALGGPAPDPLPDPAADAASVLDHLVRRAQHAQEASVVWLTLVAICGRFPRAQEVQTARRYLELASPDGAALWLLETFLHPGLAPATARMEMDVVVGGVVADVDFCARHDLNTGIQRVVREAMPRWVASHEVVLAAWTPGFEALRDLDRTERDRVVRWDRRRSGGPVLPETTRAAHRLVVPWRSTLTMVEVPAREACEPLAALAELSGNRVSAIGYDAIPIVSADLVPATEPNRFVRYLTIIKHADRVAGISVSAAAEFRGFADMLPTQGLEGPVVEECELPVQVPKGAALPTRDPRMVLVVGSHDPRKNHLSVMHAAEQLWREGLRFELRFVGGSGWDHRDFDARLQELRRTGRSVTAHRSVGDDELWGLLRSAWFTVFPSFHEGYGLPVAESLACGTPAITTDYGSTREIGEQGGAVLVDPRRSASITDAMRRLLTDDGERERLHREALARPPRTWDDYAHELWTSLVDAAEGVR